MQIFDIHAHIYPDAIAARATLALTRGFDNGYVNCDGRLSTLLDRGDRAGITRFAVHSVATHARQTSRINDFVMNAAKMHPDRLIPFAALHPDDPALPGTIEGIVRAGFRGIKLHPEQQGFKVDEPRAVAMFREIGASLPILMHCGDYRCDNSMPHRILNLLYKVPEITLICAHLGGWTRWRQASEALRGSGVYTDVSSALFSLPRDVSVELIRGYGIDHVFFGSDFPIWNPVAEVRRFMTLPLTEEERQQIFWGNYERMFS